MVNRRSTFDGRGWHLFVATLFLVSATPRCRALSPWAVREIVGFRDPYPLDPMKRGAPNPRQALPGISVTNDFQSVNNPVPAIIGNGLEADGTKVSQDINVPARGDHGAYRALTVEFWFRERIGATPGEEPFFNFFGPGFRVELSGDSRLCARIDVSRAGEWIGSDEQAIPSVDVPKDPDPSNTAWGSWHHYAFTTDAHTLACYRDGEVYATRIFHGNAADGIGPKFLYREAPDAGQLVATTETDMAHKPHVDLRNVTINELRISTVALSAAEVRGNFERYRSFDQTYFVTDGGTGSGSTDADPMSLSMALKKAGPHVKIIIRPGRYHAADFQVTAGGTCPYDACLIQCESLPLSWLIARMTSPESLRAVVTSSFDDGPASVSGSGFVTLRNITFVSDNDALLLHKSPSVRVDCCTFESEGIAVKLDQANGCYVENCLFRRHETVYPSVKGTCIQVASSQQAVVRNNSCLRGEIGVQFQGPCTKPAIIDNLFAGLTNTCVMLKVEDVGYSDDGYLGVAIDYNAYDPAPGGAVAAVSMSQVEHRFGRDHFGLKGFATIDASNMADASQQYRSFLFRNVNVVAFHPSAGAYRPELHSLVVNAQLEWQMRIIYAPQGPLPPPPIIEWWQTGRLLPVAGNPVDCGGCGRLHLSTEGVPYPHELAFDPTPYDMYGRERPIPPDLETGTDDGVRNLPDIGAFESAGSQVRYFTLDQPATTSAGVFLTDGTLLRTLWSGRQLPAGTVSVNWNGLTDSDETYAGNDYEIKLLAHNVSYQWLGVIGNNSTKQTGGKSHGAGYEPNTLAIGKDAAGNEHAYYVTGFAEGLARAVFRFDPSNPNELTGKSGSIGNRFRLWHAAASADTGNVYFAGADNDGSGWEAFVTAFPIGQDECESPPTFGVGAGPDLDRGRATRAHAMCGTHFGSVVAQHGDEPGYGCTGIAIASIGGQPILFLAHHQDATIYRLQATNGTLLTPILMPSNRKPWQLAVTGNGDLLIVAEHTEPTPTTPFSLMRVPKNNNFGGVIQELPNAVHLNHPRAMTILPAHGSDPERVLVADGGDVEQLIAFDTSGTQLWTFGAAGGYATPTVLTPTIAADQILPTSEKLRLGTALVAQPDGSFWFNDTAVYRMMHAEIDTVQSQRAALKIKAHIDYLPGSYHVALDKSDPTRLFSDWIEYKLDLTKLAAWDATSPADWYQPLNFWRFAFKEGNYRNGFDVVIQKDGKRFGTAAEVTLRRDGQLNPLYDANGNEQFDTTAHTLELPPGGAPREAANNPVGWQLQSDGLLFNATTLNPDPAHPLAAFKRRAPLGTWATADPNWESEADAVVDALAFDPPGPPRLGPYPAGAYFIEPKDPTIPTGRRFTAADFNHGGWHLGGVSLDSQAKGKWLWKAFRFGPDDGRGAFDSNLGILINTQIPLTDATSGTSLFVPCLAEVQGAQVVHFHSSGLFIGQFIEHVAEAMDIDQSKRPASQGRLGSCDVAPLGNGKCAVFTSDESGQSGMGVWRVEGLDTIKFVPPR